LISRFEFSTFWVPLKISRVDVVVLCLFLFLGMLLFLVLRMMLDLDHVVGDDFVLVVVLDVLSVADVHDDFVPAVDVHETQKKNLKSHPSRCKKNNNREEKIGAMGLMVRSEN
jgi:hypothetical protein